MDDRQKRAHLLRAKRIYEDESVETPGPFEDFFANQYIENHAPKRKSNKEVTEKYLAMLARARGGDIEPKSGLLSRLQGEVKGPYPANEEEDDHLLEQLFSFIYSEQLISSLRKTLKTAKENLAKLIAQNSAHISARIIMEIRKKREVTEPMEATIIRITVEEMWGMAKNYGMKKIKSKMVDNTTQVAQNMFDQFEQEMKGKAAAPQQAPQQPPPQQGMPQGGLLNE